MTKNNLEKDNKRWNLNNPIIIFSKDENNFPLDKFTLGDATRGVKIFGGTGSGKSSGSGKIWAKKYLANGFGFLVLTVKQDEKNTWLKYAEMTGREGDVVVIDEGCNNQFNFLNYFVSKKKKGENITENLVDLFVTISSNSGDQSGDSYWLLTFKQLLRNAIDLILLGQDRISIIDVYDLIITAPKNEKEADQVLSNKDTFKNKLFNEFYQNAKSRITENKTSNSESLKEDFKVTEKYWLDEYPSISDKTRSIIVSHFTSMADCFMRGTLRDLFCKNTTEDATPEAIIKKGKIVIIDLPIHKFKSLGRFAQAMYKYITQLAITEREKTEDMRPVCIWADEAQYFISDYDTIFQSTARSSNGCMVYLTQNIPLIISQLSGSKSNERVKSLLGNMQTSIFHCNSDLDTNKYASDLISKVHKQKTSSTQNKGDDSTTISRELEYQVLDREFSLLAEGGEANNYKIEAFIHVTGKIWKTDNKNTNFYKCVFDQKN